MSLSHILSKFNSLLQVCMPETVNTFYTAFLYNDKLHQNEVQSCQALWKYVSKFSKQRMWDDLLPHTQVVLLLNWGRFKKPTDTFRGTNPYKFLEADLVPFFWEDVPSPDLNTSPSPFPQLDTSVLSFFTSDSSDIKSENEAMAPRATPRTSTQAQWNANQNWDDFIEWQVSDDISTQNDYVSYLFFNPSKH